MSARLPLWDSRNWVEKEKVMSEVHLGCPHHISGSHISHFAFAIPSAVESLWRRSNELIYEVDPCHQAIYSDDDGDLVLPRRNRHQNFHVIIQHSITSSILDVGLQVWLAELTLADFVLHKMFTSCELNGVASLELGAGTGLVGILLAQVAQTVFLTDRGDTILENCAKNVVLNSHFLNKKASVHVRELDWNKTWPPVDDHTNSLSNKRYSWTRPEIEVVQTSTLFLAADVIYSDDLTDAFFSTLEQLMSHNNSDKVLYLALVKRYNFCLNELDIVANGYSHFRSYVRDDSECKENGNISCFVGKRMSLTQVPQYIQGYDRGKDVEIWQIKYKKI